MFGARNIMSGISGASRRRRVWWIRPPVGLHSSRLTLESNYNDRRRNPSLGREFFLERRAGRRVAQRRYAHALPSCSHPRLRTELRATLPLARPVSPPTPPRTVITQFVRTPHFQGRPSVFMAAATATLIPRPCLFQFLFV